MSTIRDGLLALLTQGPAYGLQLRNELDARLRRAHKTNVGQIYATLERLVAAGLTQQISHTVDGLPLYQLTEAGQAAAGAWMRTPHPDESSRWESMISQVLIVKSLPGVSSAPLIHEFSEYWQSSLQRAQDEYEPELAADLRSQAEEALCIAALNWLTAAANTTDIGTEISSQRPPRGRPSVASTRI